MEILRTISFYTEDKQMPFLLIGGQAVNAYGISRQTGDIDFVVSLDTKNKWDDLLIRLQYKRGQNDNNFARYRSDEIAAWPIDLMFVDNATFEKLFAQSKEVEIGAVALRVASAKHLVALKIHALKHYQEHRYSKDLNDVVLLLKNKEAGVSKEELQELCLKYADENLYKKLIAELNW